MNLQKMQILSFVAFSYMAYLKGGEGGLGVNEYILEWRDVYRKEIKISFSLSFTEHKN